MNAGFRFWLLFWLWPILIVNKLRCCAKNLNLNENKNLKFFIKTWMQGFGSDSFSDFGQFSTMRKRRLQPVYWAGIMAIVRMKTSTKMTMTMMMIRQFSKMSKWEGLAKVNFLAMKYHRKEQVFFSFAKEFTLCCNYGLRVGNSVD